MCKQMSEQRWIAVHDSVYYVISMTQTEYLRQN